jgi:glucokinase
MTTTSAPDFILSVDLGGTKVATALISSQGIILNQNEEPTCQEGPQPCIDQIVRLLQYHLRPDSISRQVMGIGVGIPAILRQEDDLVIWAPNLKDWRNVALREALEERLGFPAFIEYDGHAAVLGEWWQGAGRGYNTIAMVIIGTGIGGGLILDGKLFRGFNRVAGAAGWFALTSDASNYSQRSRSLGHWESLASGSAIADRAMELLPAHPDSSLNRKMPITARDIFDQARSGDAFAGECVQNAADILGIGVANIISLINPEIVILGGSVGRQGDLLEEKIRAVVSGWAQPISAKSVLLHSSELGVKAGLYGAAYAVLDRTKQRKGKEGG